MTVPLSTLPAAARFRISDGVYTKCQTLAWDALRENPDHDLYGVDPQVQPRPDAVYVVRDGWLLVLMRPDVEVEPLPPAWAGQRYRVTAEMPLGRRTYGADTIVQVRELVSMIGRTTVGAAVAIELDTTHINADGTPCREQGKGLQWRAVEARVAIGSINL